MTVWSVPMNWRAARRALVERVETVEQAAVLHRPRRLGMFVKDDLGEFNATRGPVSLTQRVSQRWGSADPPNWVLMIPRLDIVCPRADLVV